MNKYAELVMAWLVGGLIGRLVGYTYLVKYLGWPEFCGWLSVPIGSALAWLVVELKVILPALQHAYRWTKKPDRSKVLTEFAVELKDVWEELEDDVSEFRKNWGWRLLRAASIGLLCSSWLLVEIGIQMIDGFGIVKLVGYGIVLPFLFIGWTVMFLDYMNWDIGTYDRCHVPGRESYERQKGLETLYRLLFFNPISPILICVLIAAPYWVIKWMVQSVVWLSRVIWMTIRMVNSSQRMAAMTGAAIGLTLSQIYGFNPVICGGICVLSGLAERIVFTLAEKAVASRRLRQEI